MRKKEFEKFKASSLYCPKCRQATEARERLLLVLPSGNLFEYYCSLCGTSVGKKEESNTKDNSIVIASG